MTVVVVTGGSAGVGRAVVRRFARDGARIGLLARGRERLEAAAAEVERAGGKAVVLPCDVADADAVESAAQATEDALGPIDIWVNCAMATVFAPVAQTTPEEYRRVTEVTYLGYVHGTLAALKRMKARDRGTIVQVGSALAYRSIPLQSAYCAAKHAIVGFTDSLRSELIHDRSNIDLTVVHLPAVNTPQFDWARSRMRYRAQPLPPIFEPEAIADAIHHAAFHPRREYWLGYPTLKAILGQKLAPGLADRVLAQDAYAGQMTDVVRPTGQRDNLFEPVPGPFGARGRFSDRSSSHSPFIWASEHRDMALLAGGVIGLGILGAAAAALLRPRAEQGETPAR